MDGEEVFGEALSFNEQLAELDELDLGHLFTASCNFFYGGIEDSLHLLMVAKD